MQIKKLRKMLQTSANREKIKEKKSKITTENEQNSNSPQVVTSRSNGEKLKGRKPPSAPHIRHRIQFKDDVEQNAEVSETDAHPTPKETDKKDEQKSQGKKTPSVPQTRKRTYTDTDAETQKSDSKKSKVDRFLEQYRNKQKEKEKNKKNDSKTVAQGEGEPISNETDEKDEEKGRNKSTANDSKKKKKKNDSKTLAQGEGQPISNKTDKREEPKVKDRIKETDSKKKKKQNDSKTVAEVEGEPFSEENDKEDKQKGKNKSTENDSKKKKKKNKKVEVNDEEKDDSKDFAPKRHRSKDSDDTSKVPKKKPKGNTDIRQYVTRSTENKSSTTTNSDVKSKDKCAKGRKTATKDIEGTDVRDGSENEEEVKGFDCPFCKKNYTKYVHFKAHKIICASKTKKVSCVKCGKGFNAKSLMEQHYDFMHTNKPKRFVCKIHNKAFKLKKSLDEHNMRLHNTAAYKFQCDICGRGFFHRSEFTTHRAQQSNLRPFQCGQCKDRAFSTEGNLRSHLSICRQTSKYECTICGKFYSSSSNLGAHVSDVHKDDVTWSCPLCEDKVYSSHGGYYRHLRDAHNISRTGKKLTDAQLKKIQQEEAIANEDKSSSSEKEDN